MKQQPRIEYLSQQHRDLDEPEQAPLTGLFASRLKLFVLSFVVSLVIGLVVNYARPPVFQSNATLLTSAATAIDQSSSEIDFQNVAIQRQKLLSSELLDETLSRLKNTTKNQAFANMNVSDIRNMLTVKPIEQTNLLTMEAQGSDPDILPVVINSWIDVYLDAREASVANSTRDTVVLVRDELSELDKKVEQAQQELDRFRKENDINSTEREENEVLAKLKSLNTNLNDANENVVKTKARLDAVNLAIANGQTVVPEQEQRTLTGLEKRYQELKEKLAEFDKKYTRQYLALQPALKYIPEQIKELEAEIKRRQQEGKQIVWTQANQDYYAAKQVAADIRQQLDDHKQRAASFTTLFAKHQKLIDDLAALVEIQRETRDRLVKIESKQYEKYPQVDVVERASVNRQAVSPDYLLGNLIAFVSALLFAFFSVWLNEFLTRGRQEHNQFVFPVAWFGHTTSHEQLDNSRREKTIENKSRVELPAMSHYNKLADEQIQKILNHVSRDVELLILLLLSGMTIDEIIGLTSERIDLEKSEISVDSESPRIIRFGNRVREILARIKGTDSIWLQYSQLYVEDAKAMLYCALVDSGLEKAEPLDQSLRQAYIIFLVEQGLKLSALPPIVGSLSPLELAGYGEFSPPGEGVSSDQIRLIHPLCLAQ